MPTTDETGSSPKVEKGMGHAHLLQGLACAALTLAIFLAINELLGFVFGNYGTLAGVSWDDYRAADNLDTVIVGNSNAQRGLDPNVLDGELGSNTVSLATSGAMIDDTFAAIRTAVEGRGVHRVILGMGTASLTATEDVAARAAYTQARYEGDPVGKLGSELHAALRELGSQTSLAALSPWAFTQVATNQAAADNVRAKLSSEPRHEVAERVNAGWTYGGKGYGNFSWTLDPSWTDTTVGLYGPVAVSENVWAELDEICAYCQEKGVELVVVSTPHTARDLRAYGQTYPDTMDRVRQVVEGHGGTFLDGNMIRPEVMRLSDADFADFEHLNQEGATTFSRALARELGRLEAGQDVSGDFYSSYDEWLLAHPVDD